MPDEIQLWEYRVQKVGSASSGVKTEELELLLNEWGQAGWEVVSALVNESNSKITIIAKRPLTNRTRQNRAAP